MDDKTKTMMLTMATGVIKKGLLTLGASLTAHGVIAGNQVETFAAIGMVVVSAGWSFYQDYGKAILISQLEVLKAKSLAQAQKMTQAGVTPVTASQIANQSPTLTPAEVTKTVATLPEVIQANVKAAAVVAVLVLGALFALPGDAAAQGIKVRAPQITGDIAADAKANLGIGSKQAAPSRAASPVDGLSKIMDSLSAVEQKVVDGAIADINAADADAASLINASDATSFKDPISHACYPAAIKFLQSLPVATAPTGEFILVQLFQKKRDFIAQIRAGLPVYLKLGCAPLLGDEAAILGKLLGLIGVKVGLDALVPGLGLAMPVL